jgi:MoaA/NifB/PqqE/SkfB family radical SAM enzyme
MPRAFIAAGKLVCSSRPDTCTMNPMIPAAIAARIPDEQLSLEVTARCNAACAYCFARAGDRGDSSLEMDTAAMIVKEGRELGYRRLHLTGGEPFMWEPTPGLIDFARSRGFNEVFINTNGILAEDAAIETLYAHREILSFSVSIDWPEALHDDRRGAGSFAAASRGLALLLDAGMRCCVFTCVDSSNVSGLPRFAEHVFRGFPRIDHLTIIPLHGISGNDAVHPTGAMNTDEFMAMVRSAALLNLYGWTTAVLDTPLAPAAARAAGMPWIPRALPLKRPGRIMVLSNRSITVAHSTAESFGVYDEGSLAAALASEAYASAIAPDPGACARCAHEALCLEYGAAPSTEVMRDDYGDAPFCARVLRAAKDS